MRARPHGMVLGVGFARTWRSRSTGLEAPAEWRERRGSNAPRRADSGGAAAGTEELVVGPATPPRLRGAASPWLPATGAARPELDSRRAARSPAGPCYARRTSCGLWVSEAEATPCASMFRGEAGRLLASTDRSEKRKVCGGRRSACRSACVLAEAGRGERVSGGAGRAGLSGRGVGGSGGENRAAAGVPFY